MYFQIFANSNIFQFSSEKSEKLYSIPNSEKIGSDFRSLKILKTPRLSQSAWCLFMILLVT